MYLLMGASVLLFGLSQLVRGEALTPSMRMDGWMDGRMMIVNGLPNPTQSTWRYTFTPSSQPHTAHMHICTHTTHKQGLCTVHTCRIHPHPPHPQGTTDRRGHVCLSLSAHTEALTPPSHADMLSIETPDILSVYRQKDLASAAAAAQLSRPRSLKDSHPEAHPFRHTHTSTHQVHAVEGGPRCPTSINKHPSM